MADGRHTSSSSAVTTSARVAAVAAVLAVLVVGVFMLSGGSAGPLGPMDVVIGGGDDTPAPKPVPNFTFKVTKIVAVPTAARVRKPKAQVAAKPAALRATDLLDTFYTRAFLDPANWQDGSYEEVLELFNGGAKTRATKQLRILTAGAVGDALDSILPQPSTLRVKVLLNPENKPHSMVGIVRFAAKGTGDDRAVLLVSEGQFIFERVGDDWKVVSFSVARSDKRKDVKAPTARTSGAGVS